MDRPQFVILGQGSPTTSFSIANISESGICMEHTGKITVNVGDIVHGTVHFRSEEVVKVVGKVIRKTDDRLILHLDIRIPLPIIMAEQRFLIQKYKTLTLAQ